MQRLVSKPEITEKKNLNRNQMVNLNGKLDFVLAMISRLERKVEAFNKRLQEDTLEDTPSEKPGINRGVHR